MQFQNQELLLHLLLHQINNMWRCQHAHKGYIMRKTLFIAIITILCMCTRVIADEGKPKISIEFSNLIANNLNDIVEQYGEIVTKCENKERTSDLNLDLK
jgi:hypothetical protein